MGHTSLVAAGELELLCELEMALSSSFAYWEGGLTFTRNHVGIGGAFGALGGAMADFWVGLDHSESF